MAWSDQVATVEAIEKHIHAWHRFCEQSRRLEEIPGIGPIVATGSSVFVSLAECRSGS